MKNTHIKLKQPAKTILAKMISKKKEGISKIRPKDLNPDQKEMNWKFFYEGINQLVKFKLIKPDKTKHNATYYSLHSHYLWQALKIGRQNSDISELQSFPFEDIINLSTTKGKTTIYGLKSEVFWKSVENSRDLDIGKTETLNLVKGIKAKEIFGEVFVPLNVKIKKQQLNLSENELIEAEIDHYLNLIKNARTKAKKIEEKDFRNIMRAVISRHRNASLNFEKLGENITEKLLELKKQHRYSALDKTYKELLKEVQAPKIKKILKALQKEFLKIVNHTDIDKNWLERAIFEFKGFGVGVFSSTKELRDPPVARRFNKFSKTINKLQSKEKEKLIDFLLKVFAGNLELYPTNTAFICRAHSQDASPEGIPLKH